MMRPARECLGALREDQRGAVPLEYVVVTALALLVVVAIAGLGGALLGAEKRAQAVLSSNTP